MTVPPPTSVTPPTVTAPPVSPMQRPLRATPAAFRWFLAGTVVAVLAAEWWAAFASPGPSLGEVFSSPGMIGLLLLVVLADLYPVLPRMQGLPGVDNVMVSAPLSIAALLAYGPSAAVVFLISGLLSCLRRRWWRALLSATLWGLQGVAAALVLVALGNPELQAWADPGHSGSWSVIVASVLVVVVIETVNILLIGVSYALSGQQSPREYLAGCLEGRFATLLGLTAPVAAVAALRVPWLLPLVAVATVGSLEAVRTAWLRTVLAGTDPLTGAANRAALLARLSGQLGKLTDGDRVAVLLVDLDGFKAVNDEYGHLVGDQVLIEVAERMGAVTRAEWDLVARFGGDEFAVLLGAGPKPGDGPPPAEGDVAMISERIRAAIAEPMPIGPHTVRIGASVGWAEATSPADEPIELFERADAELYATKATRVWPRRVLPSVPVDGDVDAGRWSGPTWSTTRAVLVVPAAGLPVQRSG